MVEICADWHPAGFWELSYRYAKLPLYTPLVHGAVAEVAHQAEALDDTRAAAAEQVLSADSRDRRNGLRQ